MALLINNLNDLSINIDHAILDSGSTDNVVPFANVNNFENMKEYKSLYFEDRR
jgi:hypothetical protein